MALIDTTHLDAGTDKIKLARPSLKAMADWLNGLMGSGADPMSPGEKTAALGVLGAAALAVTQSFTRAQRGAIVVLADAATITPDFDTGNNFSLTIAGNRTLANPTNTVAGQSGHIFITQDGTGGRTLAYGSNWKFVGGAPSLSTASGAIDRLDYTVKSATEIHAALAKGVA
jgi:hypothetical protein